MNRLCEFRVFCVDRSCLVYLCLIKQLAARAHGPLRLPQGRSAVVAERIERADVGERDDLVAPETGAGDEIIERCESYALAAWRRQRNRRRARPVTRTHVAEPAAIGWLEHRFIVTPALRTDVWSAFACGTFTLRRDSLRGLPSRSVRRPRRLAISHGNRTPGLFAQTFDITQPESNRAIGFAPAIPVGMLQ